MYALPVFIFEKQYKCTYFFFYFHLFSLFPCSPDWLSQSAFFFVIGQTVCHSANCQGRFSPTCCQVIFGTCKCDNYGRSTPSSLFNLSGAVEEQCVIQTVAADDGHAQRYVR